MTPERWHIYVVDLEPRIGTKPGKQRPALAIQPNEFSRGGLPSTVILPLTSNSLKGEGFPLRVLVPKGVCGLDSDSDVLVDQILAWDNSLFKRDLGQIPVAIQARVSEAVADFLDLF